VVAIALTVVAAVGIVGGFYEFNAESYWCSVPPPLNNLLICQDTQTTTAQFVLVGVIATLMAIVSWIWVKLDY
jgi:hypothetical protein